MLFFKFLISHSKKFILSFCLVSSIQSQSFGKGFPNEYYEITDTNEAKNYFFNHMYEIIAKENNKIKDERHFVKEMLSSNILNIDFDSANFRELLEIKQKYKIKHIYTLPEYLKKIDIVPPSLAIAQAAIESAWGKSRFVKEASNIFGHGTYNEEIGILPKRRNINSSHFSSVENQITNTIKMERIYSFFAVNHYFKDLSAMLIKNFQHSLRSIIFKISFDIRTCFWRQL